MRASVARRVPVAALAAALGLILLLLGPALLGGRELHAGDLHFVLRARDRFLAGSVASGQGLPLWSPSVCGGFAVLPALQVAPFYPPTLLLALVAHDRAVTVFVALHFVLAALGAHALARELGAGARAALVAALAYAFGGALVSCHETALLLAANAGAGWVAWGALRAARGARGGFAALVLSLLLVFLDGDPQACVLEAGLALVVALAAAPLDSSRAWLLSSGRASLALAAAAVSAALLGAVQLVPAALGQDELARAQGLDLAHATVWSTSPWELPGVLVPFLFGARSAPASTWFSALATGDARPWAETLYVGPVVLALALAGIPRLRTSPLARAGLALVVLFVPLALGRDLPFFRWLHDLPPTSLVFRSFRYPAKFLLPASLGLALLAAGGLEGLASLQGRRALARALGGLALVALVALLGTVAASGPLAARIDAAGATGVRGETALAALAPRLGLVLGVALAALAVALAGRSRARTGAALAALVALDLGLAQRPAFSFAPREPFERAPRIASVLAELPHEEGPPRVASALSACETLPGDEAGAPVASDLAHAEGLFADSGWGRGVYLQEGFLANPPLRWALLERELRAAPFARRVQLLGARYVLVRAGTESSLEAEVSPVGSVGSRALVRLERAPPWAALYSRARLVESRRAAARAVADPAFDPRREVVLEAPVEAGVAPDESAGDGPGRAWLASPFENERFEVAVEARASAWLVVREAFARGWTARVDGVLAPIVAADVGFRAVRVPAGARRVAFVYEAPGLVAGAWISGLSVVAAGLAAALGTRRRARAASLPTR